MTPGYGFAYFRWRTKYYAHPNDETEDCVYVRSWRNFDFLHFGHLQAKP